MMGEDLAKWRADRRTGIGGSDAAAIVGRSPWKTRLQVYLDKIGEFESVETEAMRRGKMLEQPVRQMYADSTGRSIVTPAEILRNPRYPFALANLDGIASSEIVLECKTAVSRQGWGNAGSDEIPEVYFFQVQHYLMVTELRRADVAVLFGDFVFAIYTVMADADFHALLAEREEAFWRTVQSGIPPEPQTPEDVKLRWPRSVLPATEATERDVHVAGVLADVKRQIATLEEIKDQAESLLKLSIRDSDGLRFGEETLCTWKSTRGPSRFDVDRFRADHPNLYSLYQREATSQRRFLLKEKTQCLKSSTTLFPTIPTNLLEAPGLDSSPCLAIPG